MESPIDNIIKNLNEYFVEIKSNSDHKDEIAKYISMLVIKDIKNLESIETFDDNLLNLMEFLKKNEYGLGNFAKTNISRTAEQSIKVKFDNVQLLYNIYRLYYKNIKNEIIQNMLATEKFDMNVIISNIGNKYYTDFYLQQIAKNPNALYNMEIIRFEVELLMGKYDYNLEQFFYKPICIVQDVTEIKVLPKDCVIFNRLLENNMIFKTPQSDIKDYYTKALCDTDLIVKTADYYSQKFKNKVEDFGVKVLGNISKMDIYPVLEKLSDTQYRNYVIDKLECYKLRRIIEKLKKSPVKLPDSFELQFPHLDSKTMIVSKQKESKAFLDPYDFVQKIKSLRVGEHGKISSKDLFLIVKNIIYKNYDYTEDKIASNTKLAINNIAALSSISLSRRLNPNDSSDKITKIFEESFISDENDLLENLA
jgi:hypothetical protein